MAITRNLKSFKRTTSTKHRERKVEDFDLGFDCKNEDGKSTSSYRIYVIDEKETISFSDGRYVYSGPSLVVVSRHLGAGSVSYDEYHVNDPIQWAWIRRTIAEGIYTAETSAEHPIARERDLVSE